MTDATQAAPGAPATPAPTAPAQDGALSASDAARMLADARWKRNNPESQGQQPEAAPTPDNELAGEANGDPVEPAPAEVQDEPDQEESLPPIEPPRSWSAEDKERFKGYPHDLQVIIAEREQQRDREVRRLQNEDAERRKAFEAERARLTEAQSKYEQTLPALMQAIQDAQAGEFADVRSMADVERLASDDPARYLRWTAHQQKLASVHAEVEAAQKRQAAEYSNRWNEYAATQDRMFAERIPDITDPAKAKKVMEGSADYLRDRGFNDSDLGALWNGQASISLRDARIQEIIVDAYRYREAQRSLKTAQPKPIPPVQRPGAPTPRTSAAEENLKALTQKFEQTRSARDAAALLQAQRQAAASSKGPRS